MMTPRDFTIDVDGRSLVVRPGDLLLGLLQRHGIHVPTLCWDERLAPYGGCRLCVVARRDGPRGLVPSCSTPVEPGMVIETSAPDVVAARRQQLEMLTTTHRFDCPICERSGDCLLQDAVHTYGGLSDTFDHAEIAAPSDDELLIAHNPSRCILCGKCTRLCDEVQGVSAIGMVGRGLRARVTTFEGRPLDCEFCGQCVNACPVGALTARPFTFAVPFWLRRQVVTTCSFCSCGCQVSMEVDDGTLLRVTSEVSQAPNNGKLCAKGWLGWDVREHPDRISVPLLRKEGQLVEVSWEEALQTAASALVKEHSEGAHLAALGSARLTCEDAYSLQRLFRGGFESPHVTSGISGGLHALEEGLVGVLDRPRTAAGFDELAAAELIVVVGADPANTHPLIKTEIVQGVAQRRQRLRLISACGSGLERLADQHFRVAPGSESILLRWLAKSVVDLSPAHGQSIRRLQGSGAWLESLASYEDREGERLTGAGSEAVETLALSLIRSESIVFVLPTATGLPFDEAELARDLAQLVLLLGRSAKMMVLGEMANLQGVIDVGLSPVLLPGHRRADRLGSRRELARSWQVESIPGLGWDPETIMSRATRGDIGVLYVVGQDLVGSWPRGYDVKGALEKSRFVVCHEAFLTETALRADAVFPVSVLAERQGSVVGCDGVRRVANVALPPPVGVLSDGQILAEIARRSEIAFPDSLRLEDEMLRVVGWPFERPRTVRLMPVAPPPDHPISASGIFVDASPRLFHSGGITAKSKLLEDLAPSIVARVNPMDAEDTGIENGDAVAIRVGEGEILLRARLDATVVEGTVVAPWHGSPDGAAALAADDGLPLFGKLRRSR
ncbi:MAG: molybdopterin-dependent oxidoreductase [bacterium]|nr:molybdopterin-dependent oxidoreductase [bacterium]